MDDKADAAGKAAHDMFLNIEPLFEKVQHREVILLKGSWVLERAGGDALRPQAV